MKLIRSLSSNILKSWQGCVATIGTFDGVHLGHQSIIKKLLDRAKAMQLPSLVIIFEPQPSEYFYTVHAPTRLTNFREKINLLKQLQVDYVFCIRFNHDLAEQSHEFFATHYLFEHLAIKQLLVGQDFCFGKNRLGNVNTLEQMAQDYSCSIETVADLIYSGSRVSSTRVRQALSYGLLEEARKLLGRPYSLFGRVVAGQGLGRKWGIPTANVHTPRATMPLKGVYAVSVRLNGCMLYGVANLGTRPTVDGTKNVLEVHLFDFDATLYGQCIEVFFLQKIRDEVTFTSVELLIAQIQNDITTAKSFIAKDKLQFNETIYG